MDIVLVSTKTRPIKVTKSQLALMTSITNEFAESHVLSNDSICTKTGEDVSKSSKLQNVANLSTKSAIAKTGNRSLVQEIINESENSQFAYFLKTPNDSEQQRLKYIPRRLNNTKINNCWTDAHIVHDQSHHTREQIDYSSFFTGYDSLNQHPQESSQKFRNVNYSQSLCTLPKYIQVHSKHSNISFNDFTYDYLNHGNATNEYCSLKREEYLKYYSEIFEKNQNCTYNAYVNRMLNVTSRDVQIRQLDQALQQLGKKNERNYNSLRQRKMKKNYSRRIQKCQV